MSLVHSGKGRQTMTLKLLPPTRTATEAQLPVEESASWTSSIAIKLSTIAYLANRIDASTYIKWMNRQSEASVEKSAITSTCQEKVIIIQWGIGGHPTTIVNARTGGMNHHHQLLCHPPPLQQQQTLLHGL